jgi:hypothetical protein
VSKDAEGPVPRCTPKQLLAVACPTCHAGVGDYCEERPGKVLILPAHHEARFRLAATVAGRALN